MLRLGLVPHQRTTMYKLILEATLCGSIASNVVSAPEEALLVYVLILTSACF